MEIRNIRQDDDHENQITTKDDNQNRMMEETEFLKS